MLNEGARGTVIEISVRPRAGKCRIVEIGPDRVRIEVTAAPEGGKATEQALRTLADALGVMASGLKLLTGKTARHKTILVCGATAADCESRLKQAVAGH